MSFNIQVKVDASQAKPEIDQLGAALKGIEGNAKAASDGLKPAVESAQKLGEAGLKIEGSFGHSLAGRFGELGEALHGVASSGTLAAGALVGLGVEVLHITDEYTRLANSVRRLTDGEGDVNVVIGQQLNLSKDLHASLEQTIELSVLVKERTEELGLSIEQQTAFTKELGEAAVLSGRSLTDAAGVMERLGFALESGLPAGREMRSVMREFPEIAQAMRAHFAATDKQIIEMAQHGQIGMADFVGAMNDADDVLAGKMSHHVETLGQEWGHFKDSLDVAIGGFLSGSGPLGDRMNDLLEKQRILNELTKRYPDALSDVERAALAAIDGIHRMQGAVDKGVLLSMIPDFVHAGQQVVGLAAPFRDMGEAAAQAGRRILEMKPQLSDLEKLYESIVGPEQKIETDLANLEILYAKNRISLAQYNDELDRLSKHPRSPVTDRLGGGLGAAADVRNADIGDAGQSSIQDAARAKYGTQAQRDLAKYREELAALAQEQLTANFSAAEYAQLQKNIGDEYEKSLEKIKDADNSFSAGMHMAFKSIADESKNVAKDFEQAFTHAISSVNQQIVSLVQHGTFDLRGLATSIETDLLNLGLKQGEAALFGAIGGSGAGGNAALTVSTSAATDALGAFTIALGAASAALGGSGGISALSNLAALAALGGGSSSPAAGAAASDAISSARRAPSTTALQKTLAALRPR